jgi:hypothetical protein
MKHFDLSINSDKPKTIHISVADNWNELSQNQIIYIGLLWQTWQVMLRNGADMQRAKAKLLVSLIVNKTAKEIKEVLYFLSKVNYEETNANVLSLVNFIFETNKLTQNKFPYIKVGLFKKLYGPGENLSNISINEFSFAINFYNHYNTTNNEQHLTNFVACLYRPSKKNWEESGDKRKAFNPFTIEQHIHLVDKISFGHKQAILLFFSGCIELWSKQFPFVFSRAKSEQESSQQTFLDIILKLSGSKFGNFNQTKDENAFIVLKELNSVLEENQNKKES